MATLPLPLTGRPADGLGSGPHRAAAA